MVLALALARLLRRLATAQTWRPLKDVDAILSAILIQLGGRVERSLLLPAWTECKETLRADRDLLPSVLAALAGAERWMAIEAHLSQIGSEAELRAGLLAAAALTAERRTRVIPLPLWAGVPLRAGLRQQEPMPLGCSEESAAAFLTLLAKAAQDGSRELERPQSVARRGETVVAD